MYLYQKNYSPSKILLHIDNLRQSLAIFAKTDFSNLLDRYHYQGWGQVQYLYLSTYLSVLDVLEYLVYGNVKVLVLVLVLDQNVLGTWQVIFKYYLLKSVKVANYLNSLL